jgi:hypothetical protein
MGMMGDDELRDSDELCSLFSMDDGPSSDQYHGSAHGQHHPRADHAAAAGGCGGARSAPRHGEIPDAIVTERAMALASCT